VIGVPGRVATVASALALTAFAVVTLVVNAPKVMALARVVGIRFVDPPRGSHCDCASGVCPVDSNGRGCSCGCALKADAQPVARLAAQAGITCTDGMAGSYPCHDIDLMAFLPGEEIGGGTGNDVWGWTDPVTGREYALVGRSTGTAFVDISTPTRPIYLGLLPTHTVNSTWRGIKVFANHAFVVSEALNHGMQVFDLTQLRDVVNPPVTFSETGYYAGFGSTHTLALNSRTGFAYAVGTRTCEGGLHVVDVRDPTSPRTAGCFALDGYTHETQCVIYQGPDAFYRGREICLNSNEDTLTIVDATDKLEQVQLSRTGYDGSAYTHQGWLTEDQRFFLVNDESDETAFRHRTRTWIWDVSNLDAPVLATYYDGPTPSIDHNLYIRGDLVYESNYRSGLRVLDGSEVAQGTLREIGFFDIYPADDAAAYNGAWTSYPFFASGSVIVNGIEQGLFVVRPRVTPRVPASDLSVTLAGPGTASLAEPGWSFVVRVANNGSDALSETRVIEMPPTSARLLTVRASQGECSIGAVATCDLGGLAAGSEALVIVTIQPTVEGDLVSTAIASARATDGSRRELSALTTSRGVRRTPELAMRRPDTDTIFRIGRNNTVQWTLRGVAGGVSIDLSRDDGATWTRLSEESENVGFYDWTGVGGITTGARVRVTSLANPQLTQTSPSFAIVAR
jgi:choice-of-anchor B domain-containing protein